MPFYHRPDFSVRYGSFGFGNNYFPVAARRGQKSPIGKGGLCHGGRQNPDAVFSPGTDKQVFAVKAANQIVSLFGKDGHSQTISLQRLSAR
jgi:hypothetical protein